VTSEEMQGNFHVKETQCPQVASKERLES